MTKISFQITVAIALMGITLNSCNCVGVDCSYEAVLMFKLVDKTSGEDLVYDRGIEVSEFKLSSPSLGQIIDINKQDSDKTLAVFLNPASPEYQLEYQSKVVPITLQGTRIEKDCCDDFVITGLLSDADITYDSKSKIFTIKL